ncbi:glycoside hydrolase superfamily [Cubamyces lactineus]|nr:glycoside hydrolase superfamily [Cubamyces lactineus]
MFTNFSMRGAFSLAFFILSFGLLERVVAFDLSRKDNLAVYWGQDSAGNQKRLSYYCNDSTVDVFPIAFLYVFRGKGGEPVIDFANICNQWDDDTYSGTNLANCSFMAEDIKQCQAAGKVVTLSLGGATGEVGFSSDSQAETFADQVWNQFLGGESDTRPFGDAILDGHDAPGLYLGRPCGRAIAVWKREVQSEWVDLDIESGTPAHYAAFVHRIRSNAGLTNFTAASYALNTTARANATLAHHGNATIHGQGADNSTTLHGHKNETNTTAVIDVTNRKKYYYITAAPQCPYPDAYIGAALNEAPFDAVYVQFYNNYCGLDQPDEYNFDTWDKWAKTKSANPDVKVYIGAPGSKDSAGQGYVSAEKLAEYVSDAQEKYSSFGGVMIWDVSTAHTNDRFDLGIKTAMVTSALKLFPEEVPRNSTSPPASSSTRTDAADDSDKTSAEDCEDEDLSTEASHSQARPRVNSRFFRL